MITRRELLKGGVAAGTLLAFPVRAFSFAQSPTQIRKFIVTLPGLGPSAANNYGQYIPLASKITAKFAGQMTDVYKLGVAKFVENMHPDLPVRHTCMATTISHPATRNTSAERSWRRAARRCCSTSRTNSRTRS